MEYTKGVSIINFSTFERNMALYYVCLHHSHSPDGNYHDYKCNIVNNTQESATCGTVHADDEVTMVDCTVISSHSKGKLFSRKYHGDLYLINCHVDDVLI